MHGHSSPLGFRGDQRAAMAKSEIMDERLIIAILLATVAYQAMLCLANTHVFSTSRALVGLAEALVYVACVPILARRLLPGVLVTALLAGAMLCLLTLITGYINAKAFRDLVIPLCYFWLGCNIGKPDLADRALTYVIGVVLFFGLMETFFLDQYTTVFNIFSYYVSTGNLEPITEYVRESRLQMNGMRPEGIGRTLLPGLLGPHRVSSVFLEPVSLGNFATICAAWALSKEKSELRTAGIFLGVAVIFIVLSDSRFALLSVSLMIAMRMAIHGKALNLAFAAPFACIILLIVVGLNTSEYDGDNFRGRLAISGWSLLAFDISTLLGASPGEHYGDQGYAYAFSNFGMPLCLLFWIGLWLLPMPDERGLRFRAFISIYIALILCVSGNSLFALKTAGVAWFLMGCCLRAPAPRKPKYPLENLFPSTLPNAPLAPVTAQETSKVFFKGNHDR